MCLRTGPGDFKNTKRLKFDIRQIFLHIFRKKCKIKHFPKIKLLTAPVFMLLRKRNDDFDCVKTFDLILS